MLRERDPFGRALAGLRSNLRSGVYAQGEPLTIVELARNLNLSPTPVREALSRLAGEGLIEDRRGQGYFSWRTDTLDLIELYDLDALHLGAALEGLAQNAEPAARRSLADRIAQAQTASAQGDIEAVLAETLFDQIVRDGGGRALRACQSSLTDRLGPARRIEPLVLPNLRRDFLAMVGLFDLGRWTDLAELHAQYHDRRRRAADRIVARLRRDDDQGAL